MLLTDYTKSLNETLAKIPPEEKKGALRYLARTDLYFLIRYVLNKPYIEHQWIFDRCREVQAEPNNCIDIWAREHMKSTVITNGLTIQDILSSHGDYPLEKWGGQEVCVGIFSHTRPIAKGFLREIKTEFEDNEYLKDLFPDIFYLNPQRESSKWSEDDGICVKRKHNRREQTVEAYGLVDGMPTSRHYTILLYDDVVTDKSVTTPEMINKTTEAMALSYNLGSRGGVKRIVGTFYHFNDTYRQLIKLDAYKLRFYPATHNGKKNGKPVLMTDEQYKQKRKEAISSYVFACQILLDPIADQAQGFKEEWFRFCGYQDGVHMNRYLLVDPASAKKRGSDYTVMLVMGCAPDGNDYLLDGVRDRMNLTERTNTLLRLHREWMPNKVGYEKYGMQCDIEHIKEVQDRDNYRFDIIELGGNMSKEDRIRRLVGPMEEGKLYFPNHIRQVNLEKKGYDLVADAVEEFKSFPVSVHDDIMDCMARLKDPDLHAVMPKNRDKKSRQPIQSQANYEPHNW